ncbi:copper resistance protein CopD [Arthrobacter pityocampae]|uniref:Copper resistance protein CopD n=1 Tax=Arthrobacter pityocampae TaxID=547334 RepID=A0A2S5IXK6_9MICC|nr:copper resistance protein CopD [Arthrobacter pityocampae]
MVYVPTTVKQPRETTASSPERAVGTGWLILAGVVVLGALVVALFYTGAAAARQLGDPGALTRWGLPVAKVLNNTAAAATIGALVFAVVMLPRRVGPPGRKPAATAAEHPAFTRVMLLAAVSAVAWTLGALGVMIFTYSDAAGLPLSTDPTYTQGLAAFLTDFSTGRAWLVTSIVAAVLATLLFGVRSPAGLALTLVLALLNLLPMALIGHSASGNDHNAAVNSIALHLVGVCLWVGGIIALAVVGGTLGGQTLPVLKRFSALAGFAFILVVASGVVNASLRISDLGQLSSPWGLLVVFKTIATILLGGIGWMHRQWIIPQLEAPAGTTASRMSARRVLWQLIAVELLIMSAVLGVAGALGRTAPPRSEELPTEAGPARILTGYDLPPEPTLSRWFTEWRFDWLWIAVALTFAVAYVLGVVKLHRRGDSWSPLKLVSWLVGLVLLTYFTSGAPAIYGMVLFSAHMVDHMALTMVVPLFLVLGAPVTLALKALSARRDGTRGIREWILVIVHSLPSRIITHPLFAAGNFVASIIVFYYSPLFGFALREHVGHELMITHFLITGYIFVLSMIGSDPVPYRAPYPMRLLLLFATMAFHAFFGVSLMGSTSLLQASWFGTMGREWGPSALADQQVGGAVTWGVGEIPTLLLAIGVAIVWSRSDARETKRKDRAADRNNDADLAAYNSMFADFAARDAGTDRQGRPTTPRGTTTAGDEDPVQRG